MHQYLDSDGSGTSPTCVSSTIGAERLQAATQWLQQNNLKGFLGEIGAGSNGGCNPAYAGRVVCSCLICFTAAACISAIQGALCEMQQSGVWLGALWWAAGPWWGTVSDIAGRRKHADIYSLATCSISNRSSPPAEPPSPLFSHRHSSPSCERRCVKTWKKRVHTSILFSIMYSRLSVDIKYMCDTGHLLVCLTRECRERVAWAPRFSPDQVERG